MLHFSVSCSTANKKCFQCIRLAKAAEPVSRTAEYAANGPIRLRSHLTLLIASTARGYKNILRECVLHWFVLCSYDTES